VRTLVPIAVIGIFAATAVAAVEDDLRDGDKYFDQGDWRRAALAYDRAIGKAPGQVSAGAYGKRAAIYIILKDHTGGLAFLARAKQRYPDAPELLEQEAVILWETGKRDQAIRIAERVVKVRPEAFANQQLIGEYYAQRDPVRTAAAFEAYLDHRPAELESGDVLPRIRLGFAYLASARGAVGDDPPRARELYTRAADQLEYVARKLGRRPNAMVNAENGLCAAYTGLARWDQAVTVCERVIQDPRRIDAAGSVWFNLATAYLARKQTHKARSAGTEFVRLRKAEARGHVLLGDTYFAERDWPNALDHYLRAERTLKPNQAGEQLELSIRLGKTYRRMPAHLALAIEKLSNAFAANPANVELAVELGGALLEARQDARAVALTDQVLARGAHATASPEQRAALLSIAGKGLFHQHELGEARQRFETARQLRPNDVQLKRHLVTTINEQAFAAGKDARAAQTLLEQALAIDGSSPATLTNLAVVSLERGDCDGALRHLGRLAGLRGRDAVVTARLLARAHQCSSRPSLDKAREAYAAAEREARQANAQLALAEIYAEWAPLTWDADLATAVERLELAVQIAAHDARIGPAAKRNVALALYRRGWRAMRDNKPIDAAGDFERALRDPSVLRGTEPLALEFSFAVAQLDAGRSADAARLFKALAARGSHGAYLKGAYARTGSAFFAAYASYRGTTGATRAKACADLARLESELGSRTRELVASCWEHVAGDHWRAGQAKAALAALDRAERLATPDQKRRLALDRTALALGRDRLAELEELASVLPEALVNLGIVYDLLGQPRQAYDAWTRAKARGVAARDLQKWIDAKKRIYGF
jgi:lipopolysaccharide biosynthesis regulator YciM